MNFTLDSFYYGYGITEPSGFWHRRRWVDVHSFFWFTYSFFFAGLLVSLLLLLILRSLIDASACSYLAFTFGDVFVKIRIYGIHAGI